MKSNMSNFDRAVRIIIAIVIFILMATNVLTGTLAWILFAVGAVFLATSVINFCPLYAVFGITTKKSNNA